MNRAQVLFSALLLSPLAISPPIHGQPLELICGADRTKTAEDCRPYDEPDCQPPQTGRADGCSIPDSVPQAEREWAKRSFKSACDEHDICYGSKNADKGDCDSDFQTNLEATCQWMKDTQHPDEIPQCGVYADIVVTAVRVDPTGAAESGFSSGQEYYWTSCSGCDPAQGSYVRLLEDRTFSGDSTVIRFPNHARNLDDLDFGDKASSAFFCLDQNVTAVLFQEDSCGGRNIEVTGSDDSTMNLEDEDFGDKISSVCWR